MGEPLPIHEAEQGLLYISPDCDRDTWFSIAGALKDEYGEAGFELFDSWSQQGQSFDKGACKSTWRSAKAGHYTIGTLIKLAVQGGWQRPRRKLTAEERRTLRAEQERRRKERQAEVEKDEKRHLAMQEAVSDACWAIWQEHTHAIGSSPYLGKKGVGAHGIRFFKLSVLLVIDDMECRCQVLTGIAVREFFRTLPRPKPEHISFLRFSHETIAVPLVDIDGKLWAIQSINGLGTKLFPKYGRKRGCFHLFGSLKGAELVGFSEGYATSASAFELGSGWPVVACFDSGNMLTVGKAFLEAGWLEGKTPVWMADNDKLNPKTGKRAGQDAAAKCQAELGGVVHLPPAPVGEAA